MPESLLRLRVSMPDSKIVNEPVLLLLKSGLSRDPRMQLTDDPEAPMLVVSGEHTDTQTLSVGSTGRVNGYLLKYEITYALKGPRGEPWIESRAVKLMRDYSFDPLSVLAKEQEEQELKRVMQRDAVQQILRKLSRVSVPPAQPPGQAPAQP